MGNLATPESADVFRASARLLVHRDPDDLHAVVLTGRLDAAAYRPLRHLLRSMVHRSTPGTLLAVDLAAVTSADAGGLAALVVSQRLASARRCALVLRAPSPPVRAALSAHRLNSSFAVIR
jgi:anti-anti-sigma regulatory factor